jgi:hypothetical protein
MPGTSCHPLSVVDSGGEFSASWRMRCGCRPARRSRRCRSGSIRHGPELDPHEAAATRARLTVKVAQTRGRICISRPPITRNLIGPACLRGPGQDEDAALAIRRVLTPLRLAPLSESRSNAQALPQSGGLFSHERQRAVATALNTLTRAALRQQPDGPPERNTAMLFSPGNCVGRQRSKSTPSPRRLRPYCTGMASGEDCFRTGSLL